MTRRHYVMLAAALAAACPVNRGTAEDIGRRKQWEHDCITIANALTEDNRRFDHQRFIDACREGIARADAASDYRNGRKDSRGPMPLAMRETQP